MPYNSLLIDEAILDAQRRVDDAFVRWEDKFLSAELMAAMALEQPEMATQPLEDEENGSYTTP
jgi:hypothetical protein